MIKKLKIKKSLDIPSKICKNEDVERINMVYCIASTSQNKSLKNKVFLCVGGVLPRKLICNFTKFLITTTNGITPSVFFYI